MLCNIVELRRYTLHPGTRETLIELFDRAFIEPQEAAGMAVLGQFRDLDDADSFVWLRGFPDMQSRRRGLEAFYGGPVWERHRDAANATMIDSDNVLLLRPTRPLDHDPTRRTTRGDADRRLTISIHHVEPGAAIDMPSDALATLVTEHSPNTFPALPVREDAEVVVIIGHKPHAAPALRSEVLRLEPTSRSALP